MVNDLTLIEAIQRKQAEIGGDLEALKSKENEQFSEDIEAIQKHQAEIAAEIGELGRKIQSGNEANAA